MKKFIYISILLLSVFQLSAQQEAMFTHYTFNQLSINPAYAGTREGINLVALHRSQWVAFEGAPLSQVISGDMALNNQNFGIGLNINNDKIGPTRNTGIAGDFSYKLKIGDNGKLALGIKAAVNFVSVGLTDLKIVETNDAAFSENVSNEILPNFGFGAYYYTKKYYVGISTPQLLQNGFETNDPTTGTVAIANNQRHYYLLGGASFDINTDLQIEPSTFVRLTAGAPLSFDLTALFKYKERFWAGPIYRYNDSFGLMLGMGIIENLELGYAFDWSYTNTTATYNSGSHEIMLKYQIPSNSKSQGKFD